MLMAFAALRYDSELLVASLGLSFLATCTASICALLRTKAENFEWGQQELAQASLNLLSEELRFAVFSISESLLIEMPSAHEGAWLDRNRFQSGQHVLDWFSQVSLLTPEEKRSLQFQLAHSFGMNRIQWNITALGLPQKLMLTQASQFLKIIYRPEFKDEKLIKVTLVVQDVSELKRQEDQAEHQRREMEKFISLLQVEDSLFDLFMSETRKLFDEIKADMKHLRELGTRASQDAAIRMFRAVHTIKANAKLFKLEAIQEVAHEVESYLESLRNGKLALTPESLQVLQGKIMTISDEIYSYASLRKEITHNTQQQNNFQIKYRVQWIRSLMNQFASILRDPKFDARHLNLIQKEFSRALMSFDKASLRDYVRGYNQMLQEVARQSGKDIEDLSVDLEFHHFDSDMLARINDILLHCLRNAIDHGIESDQDRRAAGKQERGRIELRTREEDGVAYIEIKDNGRGIDIERVKAKAIELGLISAHDAQLMTDSETLPLLFHPGVSTATAVTEMSGRGLGMDIVRDYVQSLSGQLAVNFQRGQGTTFSMWIPTANQEYLTPFAVYDIRDLLQDVLRDFPRFEKPEILSLNANGDDRMIVFCDRLSVMEILRGSFQEMYHKIPGHVRIQIQLHEHLGRRRVDSYNFYRLNFGVFEETPGLPSKDEASAVFDQSGQMARKAGGSLFRHHPFWVELNIPSNIPMRFAEYEFRVLVFMNRISNLGSHVESFFKQVMGGWRYVVHYAPFEHGLPAGVDDSPCLVLLDSALIEDYLKLRPETERLRDGVVLFPERDLDVDILNESSILPENLLFIPPSFDEKHLHRCLAGVIFRRFLKEMVREPFKSDEELHHFPRDIAS